MKKLQKVVIKLGTSTLTQGTQKLSRRYMVGVVQQIAELREHGIEVILVSSGAVAAGRELLNRDSSLSKPAVASMGQAKLIQAWLELFSIFELQIGQVLLTKEDFSPNQEVLTRQTLSSLLKHQVIPIINENDTVGSSIGNNDSLAALIAKLLEADAVILLTDQEGLYTADPRLNPEAKLIPLVQTIDERIYALAGGSSTQLGTGGMATKIAAAQVASESGSRTIIASSLRPNILIDLVRGKRIGTLFLEGKKSCMKN